MHELNNEKLLGLVVEETGQAHDSNPVKLIVSCIKHLKKFANFDSSSEHEIIETDNTIEQQPNNNEYTQDYSQKKSSSIGLNLGYTINLNLPSTTDPAVFDAIFRSLKENLLREDDA